MSHFSAEHVLGSASHIPSFQDKNQMQFTLYPWHWGLELCYSPLNYMMFRKLRPSPDYHPESPLCCDPLVVFMVWRMLSLGGLFPSPQTPPYLLNYYWNGRLIMLTIHSNMLWLIIITSNQFIDKSPPHSSFILIFVYWRMIRSDCYLLLMTGSADICGINYAGKYNFFHNDHGNKSHGINRKKSKEEK